MEPSWLCEFVGDPASIADGYPDSGLLRHNTRSAPMSDEVSFWTQAAFLALLPLQGTPQKPTRRKGKSSPASSSSSSECFHDLTRSR